MATKEHFWIAMHSNIAKKIPTDRDFTSKEIGLGKLAQRMHEDGLLKRVRREYKQTVWRVSSRFAAALKGEPTPKAATWYPSGDNFIEEFECDATS